MKDYKAIQLKGERMAIEHKGKYAYFGPLSQSAEKRLENIIHRIDEFVFEDKKHSDSDLA